MAIYGNMVGGGSAPLKTLILTDENGNEVVGVVTESIQMFDATPADVRLNKTFVSDNGIESGENTITYRTTVGYQIVLPGDTFSVDVSNYNGYNYTSFQGLVCVADLTDLNNSVSADMIAVNNGVYEVRSTTKLADLTKNSQLKSVDFNITNNSDNYYLIYFSTCRQEE